MSKFLRATAIMAAVVLGATASQAQTIGMAGEYTEGNGIIVQIPQNPPQVACTYAAPDDARCLRNTQHFFGGPAAPASAYPHHGVYGARLAPGGLNVGDAFTVPELLMQQRLGTQVGIVLNNAVVQLNTTFTAAAPGASRTKNPQPGMRRFSAMNWSLAGVQNDGATSMGGASRLAANTVVTRTIGLETLAMTYTAGTNEFGGTMSVLLDGTGLLYLAGANIDGLFPSALRPIAGTNPVGDGVPGFATRNAAGWNYTVTGAQAPGRFKAYGPGVGVFPPVPTNVFGPACGPTPPPSPAGCNEINGFNTFGVTVAPLPGATSTKHMFAWTTGTVQIVRTAVRNGGALTITDTVTGMGYDVTGTDMGVQTRRVGMIAGSYTVRTDGVPSTQMNTQMVGLDLKMTPEPGATVALISGLGMLGALAVRRRS
jgi:hypothetical protein